MFWSGIISTLSADGRLAILRRCETIGYYYAQRSCMHQIRQPNARSFKNCHTFGLSALLFAPAVHLYMKQVRSHGPSPRIARREHHSLRLTPDCFQQGKADDRPKSIYCTRTPPPIRSTGAGSVSVTVQQATECRRRRVDHDVGERKLALRSDVDINLALQNLDELLLYMLRWLYGLDADKHKNIAGTTCYTQSIPERSHASTCQRRKHTDVLCILVAR